MGETADDLFFYSIVSIIVFGILGNILVIVSIARQKQLLKKNYYFLVLHLAVCDLGTLIMILLLRSFVYLDAARYRDFGISCLALTLSYLLYISSIFMMLIISLLRYRATVRPLKPTISRAKLTKACYALYVVVFIIGLGLAVPLCFNVKLNLGYWRFFDLFLFLVPVIFMIACYCKISRELVKQNKQIKRMGSAAVRNRHNRGRRIFLVCFCTVFCFAVGRLLNSATVILWFAGKYSLVWKHPWITYTGLALLVAGTHSANPLIYGILDKRMFKFQKLCRKKRQTLA